MFERKRARSGGEKPAGEGAYGANIDFSHEVEETLKLARKFAATFAIRRNW